MVSNEKNPLTPLAQEALDALVRALPDERELTYERAYSILYAEEDLERPAVEDIVERLYMKGHLYEIGGGFGSPTASPNVGARTEVSARGAN